MTLLKSNGTFMSAGVFSAIAASLCCITPVIALFAGSSSIAANFSWIAPVRPYLIGLSIATLAFAWFLNLKPVKANNKDCPCETPKKTPFLQSKAFLGIVTAFAILMMAFPLYAKAIEAAINKTGYTVKSYEMIKHTSTDSNISFYEAPLVCHAAPSIGCGSKAKFMLVDLEKNIDVVESASLNRKGTIVAIKWKVNVADNKKSELIRLVSANHSIALSETADAVYTNTFPDPKEWFKGKEVDQLSREEAAIIARNTIEGYKKDGLIKASFEKQLQADIEKIYADLFLSITSFSDLTTAAYNEVENKIQKAGEQYVGKGKMPRVELCVAGESCEKDKSCSKEGKSCCEKN